MKFCDLNKQYNLYQEEIDAAIKKVIANTAFINGPEIKELETQLANYTGVQHALGCASGTDALLIPLIALDIQPGDEIIVPAFTFFATAEIIAHYRAKPVFVDVDPVTFNLDPNKIHKKITSKTKGIIAVSLYGQCAEFDQINEIANQNGLWVIEDGAQSFGAEYKSRKSCSLTKIATTSFFPAKPLGCYGDGGAIFTSDHHIAEKMRIILNHGQEARYKHKFIGINGRLDTMQAAILIVKLKHFTEELKLRNRVAENYTSKLKKIVNTPVVLNHHHSTWAQYTIQVDQRDQLAQYLRENEIPTAIHYPIPLYRQEAFGYLNEDSQEFPVSEELSQKVLSLPMHPFLAEQEITNICNVIKEFYHGK
ncbi:MAG: DegT/DnrJ/EryC1/StrS family aminotransferase [Spirochaetes bacterium]|nr:DegT/DnrJ/EryC1/StrS family aminotransferase [Spirochaetota bacterium]